MHDLLWKPFKAEQLTFLGVFLYGLLSMEELTRQTLGLSVSGLA